MKFGTIETISLEDNPPIIVDDTAPSSPTANTVWYETDISGYQRYGFPWIWSGSEWQSPLRCWHTRVMNNWTTPANMANNATALKRTYGAIRPDLRTRVFSYYCSVRPNFSPGFSTTFRLEIQMSDLPGGVVTNIGSVILLPTTNQSNWGLTSDLTLNYLLASNSLGIGISAVVRNSTGAIITSVRAYNFAAEIQYVNVRP